VVVTSAQEATVAEERATVLIQEAEARPTLAEREAQERVSKVEVESATMLASARGEVKGFTRRVALLEGELADVLQARDTTKANF
jgi:hypothetical protein